MPRFQAKIVSLFTGMVRNCHVSFLRLCQRVAITFGVIRPVVLRSLEGFDEEDSDVPKGPFRGEWIKGPSQNRNKAPNYKAPLQSTVRSAKTFRHHTAQEMKTSRETK